jgi:hypothetical protein
MATAKVKDVTQKNNRAIMYVQNINLYRRSTLTSPIVGNDILYSFEVYADTLSATESSFIDTKFTFNTTYNVTNFDIDSTATFEAGQFLYIYSNITSLSNAVTLNN